MRLPEALTDDPDRHVLVSGVTLGTFAVLGIFVAFAAWGVVPREVLVVAGPPIVAAMLVEMLFARGFGIDLGVGNWAIVFVFLYLESVLFGFWMRRWKEQSERRRRARFE